MEYIVERYVNSSQAGTTAHGAACEPQRRTERPAKSRKCGRRSSYRLNSGWRRLWLACGVRTAPRGSERASPTTALRRVQTRRRLLMKQLSFAALIFGVVLVNFGGTAAVAASKKPTQVFDMPAFPFSEEVEFTSSTGGCGSGFSCGVLGATGTLAVTSITVTNSNSSSVSLRIFNSSTSANGCSGTVIGGSFPQTQVIVPANSTIHLTYPSPSVFSPNSAGGSACVAAEIDPSAAAPSTVFMTVTGWTSVAQP
jgi:hypothetical protein